MQKKIAVKVRQWSRPIMGVLLAIGIISYLCLGELRFFANHFWALGSGHKEYLILLQNNDELRPGGGFVTAYADLKMTWGIPTRLKFHNSYEIDSKSYIKPPYPHEELLKNEWYQGYTFRDANWNPNFPDATKEILSFYKQKFPESDIDGIAVVNFNVIEKLVQSMGSVKINGQKVDHAHLFSALEFEVNNVDRHNSAALRSRKDVLKNLGQELMQKMMWNPLNTTQVLSKAMDEKEIYFWFKDPKFQAKILMKNWGNDLFLPPKSDFLAINLANLGSKKADRYLVKKAEYYVDLSSTVPVAHLKVSLNFPGALNTYSDRFKGYLRVYIPASYEVSHRPPQSRVEEINSFKVIDSIIDLGPSGQKEWTFDYTLPRSLLPKDAYQLRLQKQSGSNVNTSIVITSGNDTFMESSEFTTRENKAYWQGQLTKDTDLSLAIKPDATPPYALEQVFDTLKQISIIWSEPVNTDTAHFTIQDINVTNTKTTDTTRIESVDTDQNITRLKLSGVTPQTLEQYQITMSDVNDRNRNVIKPNPKTITVVQRFK